MKVKHHSTFILEMTYLAKKEISCFNVSRYITTTKSRSLKIPKISIRSSENKIKKLGDMMSLEMSSLWRTLKDTVNAMGQCMMRAHSTLKSTVN